MKDIKVIIEKSCTSTSVSEPTFAIAYNGNIDIESMTATECQYLISCLQNAMIAADSNKKEVNR